MMSRAGAEPVDALALPQRCCDTQMYDKGYVLGQAFM